MSRFGAKREVLAPAYPPAVALIVLSTANHFLLDVIAGTLLGRASLRLARASA